MRHQHGQIRRIAQAAHLSFAEIPVESLAALRVLFSLWCLFFGFIPQLGWVSDMPTALFQPPPGISMLLPTPFPHWLAIAIPTIAYAASALLLIGWRTRPVSIVLSVALLAAHSAVASWGKINHATLLLVLPLFGAYAGWGDVFSVDAGSIKPAGKSRRGSVLMLLAFAVGWFYLTAAIPKIVGGWLSTETAAIAGWVASSVEGSARTALLARWSLQANLGPLWELADWGVIAFEALFIVAALHRRAAVVLCLCASIFHVLVLLMLNIPSTGYILLYWCFLGSPLPRTISSTFAPIPALALAALACCTATTFHFFSVVPAWNITSALTGLPGEQAVAACALPVALVLFLRNAMRIFTPSAPRR